MNKADVNVVAFCDGVCCADIAGHVKAITMTAKENERQDFHDPGCHSQRRSAEVALVSLLDQAFRQNFRPGLYLVATPIGNLADITIRAVTVLARADRIYCEDTRITRRLLDACGIVKSLDQYHDHNADQVRPEILSALSQGQTVALVSDAGTPLISDPGFRLVLEAAAAGNFVYAVPGASALTAAASVAGLPTDTMTFLGFLPSKAGSKRTRLKEFADSRTTLIVYEAPSRLAATLTAMLDVLGDRPAVVARELTKLHEEVWRGRLSELGHAAEDKEVRGEIVILVGPPPAEAVVDDDEIMAHLAQNLETHGLAKAARLTADALNVSRQRAYQLGLRLKDSANA